MKNILFSDSCRTDCWGGVEKWVIMMSQSLQNRNFNIHLICRPQGIIVKRAKEAKIPTYSANYTNSFDLIMKFFVTRLLWILHLPMILDSSGNI